jgi:hypothetical protein
MCGNPSDVHNQKSNLLRKGLIPSRKAALTGTMNVVSSRDRKKVRIGRRLTPKNSVVAGMGVVYILIREHSADCVDRFC